MIRQMVTVIELLLPPLYSAPSPAWALPVSLKPSTPEGNTTLLSRSVPMQELMNKGVRVQASPTLPWDLIPLTDVGSLSPPSAH